jgi:metal-dependent amidase/aminoacylase/carboxypeptidase family protein
MNNSEKMTQLYGCSCSVDIVKGYPALINSHELAALVKETAINTVGVNNTLDFKPIMWAEDFAYYSMNIPACFWLLGVRPDNLSEMPPLHNSRLNPSEEAMINGTAMLVSSAINFLNNKNI